MEQEARAGEAPGKVLEGEVVREKKAQYEVERSQAGKGRMKMPGIRFLLFE
jgi:hypothetical protein